MRRRMNRLRLFSMRARATPSEWFPERRVAMTSDHKEPCQQGEQNTHAGKRSPQAHVRTMLGPGNAQTPRGLFRGEDHRDVVVLHLDKRVAQETLDRLQQRLGVDPLFMHDYG